MRAPRTAWNAMVISLATIALAGSLHPADAQRIRRCVDDAGRVAYTQDSCEYEREHTRAHALKGDEARREAAAKALWVQTHLPPVMEEHRYLVTQYQFRLRQLDTKLAACASQLNDARNRRDDVLDAAQRRMYAAPRGGFTIKESRALAEARSDVDAAAADMLSCGEPVRVAREDILAALASPERLIAEAGRVKQARQQLGPELPGHLYALAEDARKAFEVMAPESYDDFSRRLATLTARVQSVRVKYVIPLQIGDHSALARAVFSASAALTELDREWQKERRLATALGTIRAEVSEQRAVKSSGVMRRMTADRNEEALQDARRQHQAAANHLAAKREAIAPRVSEATRVARAHQDQSRPLNIGALNP